MDHMPTEADALVLAMPARELFLATGFVSIPSMAVLDCLGSETWFALPAVVAEDPLAREVRLGVLVVRGTPGCREALLTADARLLEVLALLPEHLDDGSSLGALKRRAMAVACARVGLPANSRCGVELAGYISDVRLPGLKHAMVLVYRATVPPETPAPVGSSWVRSGSLAGLTPDPLCALAVAAADPRPGR
jgi:hypothetical protein